MKSYERYGDERIEEHNNKENGNLCIIIYGNLVVWYEG